MAKQVEGPRRFRVTIEQNGVLLCETTFKEPEIQAGYGERWSNHWISELRLKKDEVVVATEKI